MFYEIINKIKINSLIKKKILITNIKKNELNLLKQLIKLNIIKFIFKNKNKLILVLNFLKKNKLIFKLKNMYKTSNYKTIKLKNIIKMNNKLLIITSNKGILNNYEAVLKKIGGTVILYVWN